MQLYAMGGDLGRYCIERSTPARADGNAGAGRGKAECNRSSDAPAAAGDDDPLSFQVHVHWVLSVRYPDRLRLVPCKDVVMARRSLPALTCCDISSSCTGSKAFDEFMFVTTPGQRRRRQYRRIPKVGRAGWSSRYGPGVINVFVALPASALACQAAMRRRPVISGALARVMMLTRRYAHARHQRSPEAHTIAQRPRVHGR